MSVRPGITYFPRPSIRRAPSGTLTSRLAPTAAIRPSRTTTVASRRTVSRVIGITVTSVMAKVPGVSAPREPWPRALSTGRSTARAATAQRIG